MKTAFLSVLIFVGILGWHVKGWPADPGECRVVKLEFEKQMRRCLQLSRKYSSSEDEINIKRKQKGLEPLIGRIECVYEAFRTLHTHNERSRCAAVLQTSCLKLSESERNKYKIQVVQSGRAEVIPDDNTFDCKWIDGLPTNIQFTPKDKAMK